MNNKTIGKGLLRNEDQRLLKGKGCFSDDVNFDNHVYAAFVRSPHAHARIQTINSAPAMAKEGVLLCLTGKNWVDDGLAPIPHSPIPSGGDGLGMTGEDWSKIFLGLNFPLAPSRPRFVGEPVAMVVAETAQLAREATELIHVDYELLPAATETLEASHVNAPRVWDETASNVCLDSTFGDCEKTNKTFSEAHHITRRQFKIARNTGVPMEPRAGGGIYYPKKKKYTLYAGGGGAIRYKKELVEIFGVQPDQIRVVTNDVGGNFGTRNRVFPEYPLGMWAAKKVGRAVKNTTDRTECFLTDFQGRDLITSLEIAMDSNGKFLALKADNLSNIGAYSLSFTPLSKGAEIVTGGYDIPYACVRARGVFSNTVPTNPYRSAGRPEVIYALERLVDLAAAEMGLDRIEIRRRNLVPTRAMPYANPLGMTYDSGDYHHCLNRALELSDWNGCQNRKAVSQNLGMCRGIGICSYIESSSGAPLERAEIKIKKDKKVEIIIGTQSSGQGHETSFCQVAAEWLGVPFNTVELLQGDTSFVQAGGGSHSGRSMRMAGTVIVMASDLLIEKGKKLAAHFLETSERDIDFEEGIFKIAGTDRKINWFELAEKISNEKDLPKNLKNSLTSEAENLMRTPAFPYGTHICEVEIDPDTGALKLDRYTAIDDVGRVINPVIVDGQIHGGIVQGAGEALFEDFVFEAKTGQPLAASLMDYAIPNASDMPTFQNECFETLTPMNPLGIRSGGEAGTTPAPGAITNAIADALRKYNVCDVEMPATSYKIWAAIKLASNSQMTKI